MSLLALALPGSAYLYQGEELGLPEVLDLPDEARQDPTFFRTQGGVKGRDGCRVPIPWSGQEPPYGFTTGTPWLPQPSDWAGLTVAAQEGDDHSSLAVYRRALTARHESPVLGDGEMAWLPDEAAELIAFVRLGERPVAVLLNTADTERTSAQPGGILVECGGVTRGDDGLLHLPPESACWVQLP